ncbi:alpha/beta fold hydrolase [Streptomyces sp. NPDC002870]|uniref:alpha/beta fold hydrolase n=1 Tax=Streptomyces sp. NPDC002870 TaxID=3364666 RepID=UPI0036CA68A6
MTAALNWYRALDSSRSLEPVTVPTLYVWSTEDTAVGATAALDTQHRVTGPYRFEVLEGVSHWVPDEVPATMSTLLLEHLARFATHRSGA